MVTNISTVAPFSFDVTFQDLTQAHTCEKITKAFHAFCKTEGAEIGTGDIVADAQILSCFLQTLFKLPSESKTRPAAFVAFKRRFILKYVRYLPVTGNLMAYTEPLTEWASSTFGDPFCTETYMGKVKGWLEEEECPSTLDLGGGAEVLTPLQKAIAFAVLVSWEERFAAFRKAHPFFQIPTGLSFDPKVVLPWDVEAQAYQNPIPQARKDFHLTTPAPTFEGTVEEVGRCLKCHHQGKDTCRTGLPQANPLGLPLKGCPLDQKISEMHELAEAGDWLGALAVIMVDNPLLPLTGLRICNDCEKACIFQKQTQVDTPRVETYILDQVLKFSWGVEIYLLLTRWNPLLKIEKISKKTQAVCVVGQGPAGIGAALHLLQRGIDVLALEGLAVKPLPQAYRDTPIASYEDLWEPLDTRIPQGFGGVAEYGITSRWDKNKILLARLAVERFEGYTLCPGVRFGSQVTLPDLQAHGVPQVILATGAGKPKVLDVPGTLAAGMRQATDFLMNLQLGGAFLETSATALELQSPVVVIGGGLTAIDAATEALAYLTRLGQKIRTAWAQADQKEILQSLSEIEKARLEHYLSDAKPKVTLIYRKDFSEAPSFRINEKEVQHAIAQGVVVQENLAPKEILLDDQGQVSGVRCHDAGGEKVLPAKAVLAGIGTAPNLKTLHEIGVLAPGETLSFASPGSTQLTQDPNLFVIGDANPTYAGSVVKGLASGKQAARELVPFEGESQTQALAEKLTPVLLENRQLLPGVHLLRIRSPLGAQHVQPGQFFKLQILGERHEPISESLPLSALPDKDPEVLAFVVYGRGKTSHQVQNLKPGAALSLMGPCGTAVELSGLPRAFGPRNDKRKGGPCDDKESHCKEPSSHSHCEENSSLSHCEENSSLSHCEERSDEAIQKKHTPESTLTLLAFGPPGLGAVALALQENLPLHWEAPESELNALQALYPNLKIHTPQFPLKGEGVLFVYGSAAKLQNLEASGFSQILTTAGGPMQCMMKEVCAQCLCRNKDGRFRFSCSEQFTSWDQADFDFLQGRLSLNRLQEKL